MMQRIYLPPDYATSSRHYPVILFHDGLEYVSLASANNVLDYLIHHQRIAPLMAVFVPPVHRTPEYAGDLKPQFTAFIVQELLPWLDRRFRTRPDAQSRATLGASNGGNIALWLGLQHPEVFGHIAAQSSNVEPAIATGFQNRPVAEQQFYLDIGTYDIPILIPRVKNFLPISVLMSDRSARMSSSSTNNAVSWPKRI
jgi:enterochelin esterase family protein